MSVFLDHYRSVLHRKWIRLHARQYSDINRNIGDIPIGILSHVIRLPESDLYF